ncbi:MULTISPECIES: hypothetical protein [Citrobacter freundii complex]|uniref:hypothetical protein n=1 Tax=Citrobacter freundii complex TaxID=1344959 RepID=UPI00132F976B|nr:MULTISPECIES: hypothetical protein [Citrobacter]
MKTDHEYYCGENLRFDRPDMPLTLWRGARIALSWLGLSIGMVIIGYYTHSAFIQHTATPAVPPNFRLSDAHYIYKQQPLPEPEETVEEEGADDMRSEEPSAPDGPVQNGDLKARVKQAIAEIDQQ